MYLFGAGTLGEIALETARQAGIDVLGVFDDVTTETEIRGVVVLGGFDDFASRADAAESAAFVAIGDNTKRQAQVEKLTALGVEFPNLIDPSALISPSAKVGAGNLIMPGAYVGTQVELGSWNLIFPGVSITHHNQVGDFCFFSPNASVGGFTSLGDRCKVGMNCVVLPYRDVAADTEAEPLTVVEGQRQST
jgi:UDP-perosamine 4-acetyltransferase